MLRIAVLDDENHALERFASVSEELDEIEHCELFDDAEDLLVFLKSNPVNMVFLDIEMPGRSGMQLAEEIRELNAGISVVFVTAFTQYAVEAFELSAFDYLLKPVSKERLMKTLDRFAGGRISPGGKDQRVDIHCFRRFELRIDDQVVPLNNLKAKELLAFLISRKGAETSWDQITETLWPDADHEKAHNNLHATTHRLRKWLAEKGISRIFEARRNNYRVVPSELACDLMDLEKALRDGDTKKAILMYTGDFLEEEGYEWAYPIQADWIRKMNEIISEK